MYAAMLIKVQRDSLGQAGPFGMECMAPKPTQSVGITNFPIIVYFSFPLAESRSSMPTHVLDLMTDLQMEFAARLPNGDLQHFAASCKPFLHAALGMDKARLCLDARTAALER